MHTQNVGVILFLLSALVMVVALIQIIWPLARIGGGRKRGLYLLLGGLSLFVLGVALIGLFEDPVVASARADRQAAQQAETEVKAEVAARAKAEAVAKAQTEAAAKAEAAARAKAEAVAKAQTEAAAKAEAAARAKVQEAERKEAEAKARAPILVEFTGTVKPTPLRVGDELYIQLGVKNLSDRTINGIHIFSNTKDWSEFTILQVGPLGTYKKDSSSTTFSYDIKVEPGKTVYIKVLCSPNEPGNFTLRFTPSILNKPDLVDANGQVRTLTAKVAVTR